MSAFRNHIAETLGPNTPDMVETVFELLMLPTPEQSDEFVSSVEGALVFLTFAGIVLRIEKKDLDWHERLEHPLILQPIGSIDLGDTIVEICPGVDVGASQDARNDLDQKLRKDGIKFSDNIDSNAGTLKTHDGLKTIVIDRAAADRLDREQRSITEINEKHAHPQKKFSPLKDAFTHALNQTRPKSKKRSMQYFLKLCQDFKANGDLICGWQKFENFEEPAAVKSRGAAIAGRAYDKKVERFSR